MSTRIPLVGASYPARNYAVSAQRTLNLIVEMIEDPNENERGNAFLLGAPGRRLLVNLTSIDAAAHPLRGLLAAGGRLFVAAGTKYFELSSSYALVGIVHTIADDATHSPVTMIPNGNQLLLLSAGIVYCDNGGGPVAVSVGTLAGFATVNPFDHTQLLWEDDAGGSDLFDIGMVGQAITYNGVGYTVLSVTNPTLLTLTAAAPLTSHKAYSATPLFTASAIAFSGQYYIASRPASRQINFSGFLDGSTWAAADFALKESQPDNLRGIWAQDGQLFLLGTASSEAWQQVGDSNVPFARIDGAEASYGLASPYAVCTLAGKLYFLGGAADGKPIAYRMDGFTPVRISTHAEETIWETEGPFDAVVSYSYQEEGHYFWVLVFPDRAWVWDATSKTWTERMDWSGTGFGSYATQVHAFVQDDPSSANDWGSGMHLTGGPNDGKLYESSVNLYSNDGADVSWLRILPDNFNNGKRIYYGRMNLECASGTVGAGPAPVITRTYSDDRGNNYVNPQTASLGTSGQYSKRVYWPTSGSTDTNRVWSFQGIGQAQVILSNLSVELTEGIV